MAGPTNSETTRLLKVSAANIKNSTLSVRQISDFLPEDCVGPARRNRNGADRQIAIELAGLDQTIETDIASDAKTGKSRGFLRERRAVGAFFKHHGISAGDQVEFHRIAERRFLLSPHRNGNSNGNGHSAKPRAAEFFAGIGLVRLALERQGWQVVFANDNDPKKNEMYLHNWPDDSHLSNEDIRNLKGDDIPDCELATASFPCNDLSIAGKWEGLEGRESSMFWEFTRILEQMGKRRPSFVLLENVVGFLMKNGGGDLEQALLELNRLGFAVDVVILNAKFWTPQSRARLFIIARETKANAAADSPPPASEIRPPALAEFMFANRHIKWKLTDFPAVTKKSVPLVKIVESLEENDPHWWSQKRADYFMAQLSKRHAAIAKSMIASSDIQYATAFRRVRHGKSMAEIRTDGLAGCLRTPRGGSGRQILFVAGRGHYRVRLMTSRECARLQGVPDDYPIRVGLNQALFGFGDAVCVPAVEWILSKAFIKQPQQNTSH